MALNVNDPALRLLFGLDESSPADIRVNAAAANVSNGATYNLTAYNNSGSEGLPVVSDDRNGKAVNTDASPGTPWTSGRRWLADTETQVGNTHISNGVALDPGDFTADGEGWIQGCRFKWPELETGGGLGTDFHPIFNFGGDSTGLHTIGLTPDSNTSPATGGNIRIKIGRQDWSVIASSTTWSSDPGSDNYIDDSGWFRVVVRAYFNSAGSDFTATIWIYRESDGTLWKGVNSGTFSQANADWNPNDLDGTTPLDWAIGCHYSETDHTSLAGYVDECWFYANAGLTDDEIETIVEDGIDIPWVAPNYTYNAHDVKVAWTNESSAFPVPRDLPLGGLSLRHPAGSWGTRPRIWYEGTRPSRPWALRSTEIQFDTQGPRSSQKNRSISYDNANLGLYRMAGQLPPGSVVDVRNVEFSGMGPRRARGFKVRRDVDSSSIQSKNAFASFRTANDELFRLYKVSDQLWTEAGTGATSLSTGWSRTEQPSFAVLDDRLIILTDSKRVIWDGGSTTDSFGIAAPTSGSVAATAGTLTGTYGYAYTFYDPQSGDESGPYEVGSVALSSQGGLLSSLDTSPADARFTQQRFYRTTADGASPSYFFIGSQNNATSYTDSGAADGTLLLPQVDSTFITGVPPDTFSGVAIHQEKAFYFSGATYPNRVYWSESNEPFRWASESFVTFEAPVRAVYSRSNSLVVLTDRTIELLESDFIRDANGSYNIRRTVLSRRVGCAGPNAIADVAGMPYWIDQRGIWTLRGDQVVKVSQKIDNLFHYMNMGLKASFCAAYNHIREQVWFCVAMHSIQADNTRMQTQIVLQLGEDPRWTIYDREVTFCEQFDDDLNGIRFGGIDHIGCFKELESYEGDGIDNPASLTSCEGTVASEASSVVTVSGTSPGWTTNELRGMGVVLRDASTGTIYYDTIRANAANTFTLVGELPFTLEAGVDEYEIGGIRAYIEFSEQNLGSSNLKATRFLYHEFDNLTAGRFV